MAGHRARLRRKDCGDRERAAIERRNFHFKGFFLPMNMDDDANVSSLQPFPRHVLGKNDIETPRRRLAILPGEPKTNENPSLVCAVWVFCV